MSLGNSQYAVCRGAIHTGHESGELLPVKLRNVLPSGEEKSSARGALMPSSDGSLSYAAPFWLDTVLEPIRELQGMLELACKHAAGLNPRAFRQAFFVSIIDILCCLLTA